MARVLNFSKALGLDRGEATEPNPVNGTRAAKKTHQYSSKHCQNRNLCADCMSGRDEQRCRYQRDVAGDPSP